MTRGVYVRASAYYPQLCQKRDGSWNYAKRIDKLSMVAKTGKRRNPFSKAEIEKIDSYDNR